MTDIDTKIAELEANLAAIKDMPAVVEAIKAQIDSLKKQKASQADAQPQVQFEIKAEGSGRIANVNQRFLGSGATLVEAPRDRAANQAERALNDYLASMVGVCRTLQLGLLDPSDTRNRAMGLDQVYVGLHVERTIEEKEDEQEQPQPPPALPQSQLRTWLRMLGRLFRREQEPDARLLQRQREPRRRRLTAIESLMLTSDHRLMLLGQPGSGKSTFVNHLLLCLAEATLADRAGNNDVRSGWLARLPGWNVGALVPVRVILRDLAAHERTEAKMTPLAWLQSFLHTTLGATLEPALEPIRDALSEGRAVLLFDGLDEVVGDAAIESVVQAIEAAAATYRHSPLLVTCRVRDYNENPKRQFQLLPTEVLAPFDDDQTTLFVEAWYAELAATGRTVLGTAADLRHAIANRPEIHRLAETPLLLTMTAVVHAGRGTLPDARALLYAECVDLLLLRWRQPSGQPDVLERLGLPNFHANDLLGLMAELGFAAHEGAPRSAENADEPADLALAEVERIVRRAFETYTIGNPTRRDALASILLHEIAGRNGLLLKRSGEQGEAYGFPHRTFQEFLAGYYLKNRPNPVEQWLKRAAQPHWHEALNLMIGYQVLKDEEFERPLSFVKQLLTRSPSEQVLAGELLNQIGRERAATRYKPEVVTANGVWGQARRTLHQLAFQGQAPDAPSELRVRAGLALGTICYSTVAMLSVPGALPPLPDSRLPFAVLGPQAARSHAWQRWLASYWCAVPREAFWFGDDREGKLKQVQLHHNYAIARYLITNADFARFVSAGGYDLTQPWWTDNGRDYMPSEKRSAPRYWDEPRYNNPLQPVVGVTWYEAAAYCRWLTLQGHEAGWLARTDELRLPTSLEWEHAARGDDQRRFPWGDEKPTPEHANYDQTQIGVPSPVGCFPRGSSPYGLHDMTGNVMEWLATPHGKEQQIEPEKDFTSNDGVLQSYSEFRDKVENLCCGARGRSDPYDRNNDLLGFRIMWSRARTV